MVKKAEKKVAVEGEYAKRAQSAFFYFGNEHRARLLDESAAKNNGKKDVAYAAKAIGAMWGKLTDAEKAPFEKSAAKDKLRYQKEIESGMVDKPRKSKKDKDGKKKKDPNAPKRPSSAYMRWFAEQRNSIIEEYKLDKSKVADVARKGGALWKDVDQKLKDQYQKGFLKDSEKYQKDMEAYKAKTAAEAA